MDWPELSENAFPAPRDDEPDSLRRDIADELADHLTCSLRQQLRQTGDDDEHEAQRAVLDRFGDPERIARKLWFDWMKEKIMTGRLTLVTGAILAIACSAAVVILWMLFRQTQKVNLAILSKLETLAVPPAKPEPFPTLEWTEIKVRCVKGTKNGSPAEGFSVELNGKAINPNEPVTLSEQTNAQGESSFGPLRPGKYYVRVRAPWGQELHRTIVVLPGLSHIEEVVCPDKPPAEVNVSFEIDWPAGLEGKEFQLSCAFGPEPGGFEVEGEIWSERASTGVLLLLNFQGEVTDFTDSSQRSYFSSSDFWSSGSWKKGARRSLPAHVLGAERHMRRVVGKYELQYFTMFNSTVDASDLSRRTFTTVVHQGFEDAEKPIFEAKAGSENKWTIEVPESLVEQINQHQKPIGPAVAK